MKINEAYLRTKVLELATHGNPLARPSDVVKRAQALMKFVSNGEKIKEPCGCKGKGTTASPGFEAPPQMLCVPYNIARTTKDEKTQFVVTVLGRPFAIIETDGLQKGHGRCVMIEDEMRGSELHNKEASLSELTSQITVAISLWSSAHSDEVKAHLGLT